MAFTCTLLVEDRIAKITLTGELDAASASGGLFQLTCHPHVIGHRSRLAILRELITHMTARDDVWFATHQQVAEYVGRSLVASPSSAIRDVSRA